MYPRLKLAVAAAALFALLTFATTTPAATTFTVTKTADTNDNVCNADCSLREAIHKANTTAGTDTVKIPTGDFKLTLGQLTVNQDVVIDGAGAAATSINGNAATRVLNVTGASTDVVISDLTIKNG